jgi:hypothetical protein
MDSDLVHLTSQRCAALIDTEPRTLRGPHGLFATSRQVAEMDRFWRVWYTWLWWTETEVPIAIPASLFPLFARPWPIGPVSFFKWYHGEHFAPAGEIDLATEQFSPAADSGHPFAAHYRWDVLFDVGLLLFVMSYLIDLLQGARILP